MSATMTVRPPAVRPHQAGGVGAWLKDVWVMTRRNLLHIRREPAQLSDVTIQPVLFTLLFVYVFGAAMTLPGGASYKEFAIPGLLVMNLTMATVGTAIGLSMDLSTGVIDRLRTLPMFQTAILIGRSASDLLAAVLGGAVVLATGLAIGWRPDATTLSVAAGVGIVVLFAYAMTWVNTCVALGVKGPEAAQGVVFVFLFPLAFVSNVFAPTQGMPSWLATVADWNPVSAVTSACRDLFGAANPSASVQVWPMQHPVEAALLWSVGLLAVCIPLAGHLYRRRTRD
ncbi:MAG TPA: ABC transporter permease [Thermoleophilia bacterium]|nr:ABC transporter permease [Thermoleophilia bacterium]